MTPFQSDGVSSAYFGTLVSSHDSLLSNPWIIDSRAFHNMTGMSSLFSTYRVSSDRDKVCITDGSLSSVAGTGSIPLTSSLPLSSMFYVLTLS